MASSDVRLFYAIVSTKKGESLRVSGSLSYSRMREREDKSPGHDSRQFRLHSLRAGGATAAANHPSVSERNFKRHSRWRSESAKMGTYRTQRSPLLCEL